MTGEQFVRSVLKTAGIDSDPNSPEFPGGESMDRTTDVPLPKVIDINNPGNGETPNTVTEMFSPNPGKPRISADKPKTAANLMNFLALILKKQANAMMGYPPRVPMNAVQPSTTPMQVPGMNAALRAGSAAQVAAPQAPEVRVASAHAAVDAFFEKGAFGMMPPPPVAPKPMQAPAPTSGPMKSPGLGQVAGAGLGSQQMRARTSLPMGSSAPPTA